MKRKYLWFGLVVPAVGVGILALMKNKKPSDHGSNGKESDATKRVKTNTGETNDSLQHKPDLGKYVNQASEKSFAKSIPVLSEDKKSSKKIYSGARGGKYYLNDKGEKVYIKK